MRLVAESAMRHLCLCDFNQSCMTDIRNLADVELLVNRFYNKVKTDALLSPVFAAKIPDDTWPAHLQRMYAFWNAILFAEKGFEGNPMQKHLQLPVDEHHFTQWLALFSAAVDESFCGPKADEAKKRAVSIAQIMNFKISTRRH